MPSAISAAIDQAPALTDPGQRDQLRVAEPLADRGCLGEARGGGLDVAFEHQAQGGAVAQVALLDTVQPAVVEQALRSVDPPAAARQLALVQEHEGQPERAAGGTGDIVGLRAFVVRTRPDVDALVVPANEVRRRRQPLQILRARGAYSRLRGRQLPERVPPRPPSERLTTSVDRAGHGHSLVHSGFSFTAERFGHRPRTPDHPSEPDPRGGRTASLKPPGEMPDDRELHRWVLMATPERASKVPGPRSACVRNIRTWRRALWAHVAGRPRCLGPSTPGLEIPRRFAGLRLARAWACCNRLVAFDSCAAADLDHTADRAPCSNGAGPHRRKPQNQHRSKVPAPHKHAPTAAGTPMS